MPLLLRHWNVGVLPTRSFWVVFRARQIAPNSETFCRAWAFFDGVSFDEIEARVDCAVRLSETARGVALSALGQHLDMAPEYFHMDRAEAAKRARLEEQDAYGLRLRAPTVRALPAQWKGKRYLRLEKEGDPRAALKAETRERERWGRKVVALLVESRLPFGLDLETRSVEWTSVEAMRCLKRLRAASLRKRV